MNDEINKYLTANKFASIGDIKWAHAVNDVKYLKQILADPNVDFIEVDVSLSNSNELIAAHYQNESNLSIKELLNLVKLSNKGLKLDFKDQNTIVPALQLLKSTGLSKPVILNADILSLEDAPFAEINAELLINKCREYFPQGLLSLGWRTTEKSVYSVDDINKMLEICTSLKEITFPIRATLLPNSWEKVKKLIENDNHTLTIWNGTPINKKLLEWINKNTSPHNCFYDFKLS